MKNFGIVFFLFVLFSLPLMAGKVWKGTYELTNGFTIKRKPTCISFKGQHISVERQSVDFKKGAKLGFAPAKESGRLNLQLSQEEFLKEVSKLGKIKSHEVRESK